MRDSRHASTKLVCPAIQAWSEEDGNKEQNKEEGHIPYDWTDRDDGNSK
jgi:hypothetical protein